MRILLYLAFATILLSACGKVDMSIEELEPIPTTNTIFADLPAAETVASSTLPVAETTTTGYKVIATMGTHAESNMMETTGVQKYKVYFGVNGQVNSNQ